MKKFIIYAAILSLLLPAVSFAAAEFSMGGYIKLDTFWDSTQNNSLICGAVPRNNDRDKHHGRFNMRGQESRFNFTIKGPKVFGAQTTGFIEMDFDGVTDAVQGASGTWGARLRHAMFRLNWPETELLFGQYWGFFSNWWAESAEDGPFIMQGSALDRLPQIRLTQKFLGDWSVAALIGLPQTSHNVFGSAAPYSGYATNGSAAETPQFQGMVKYAHDWWGKAAYFGSPTPFTATVSAGWQRSIARSAVNQVGVGFGETDYNVGVMDKCNQKYLNPWMVQGALFIPVVPTHSANLAGTASILTQWFVGQGVESFGILGGGNGIVGNATNLYRYANTVNGIDQFDPKLTKRFGGWAQGQYYITNQWFVNAVYGITRIYGVNRDFDAILGAVNSNSGNDLFRTMQQVDATLWYRPIQALKFGMQYTYAHADYFQKTDTGVAGGNPQISNKGDEHRVEFVGIFYF